MDKIDAEGAIKQGVKRAKCVLVSMEFSENSIEIKVKAPDSSVIQVGCEYNWQSGTKEGLSDRVRRFAEHYCLKKPYRPTWDSASEWQD